METEFPSCEVCGARALVGERGHATFTHDTVAHIRAPLSPYAVAVLLAMGRTSADYPTGSPAYQALSMRELDTIVNHAKQERRDEWTDR